MDRKTIYKMVREEVTNAARRQGQIAPFNLSGHGHEPRLSLDRRLAAILRSCPLPNVNISGFGANNFYPARIFIDASEGLTGRLTWSPLIFRDGTAGIGDIDGHIDAPTSIVRDRKQENLAVRNKQLINKVDDRQLRKIYVIIPKWPSGTHSYRVGSAIKNALKVERSDLVLIQMSPERVFFTHTKSSDLEFYHALEQHDLGHEFEVRIVWADSNEGVSLTIQYP